MLLPSDDKLLNIKGALLVSLQHNSPTLKHPKNAVRNIAAYSFFENMFAVVEARDATKDDNRGMVIGSLVSGSPFSLYIADIILDTSVVAVGLSIDNIL